MDILDKDTLVSFLTNADDPLCHDHKRTSQRRIPQMSIHKIIFISSLDYDARRYWTYDREGRSKSCKNLAQ